MSIKPQANRATDPITAEIIRAGLVAITDEMKTNLMRTAYNVIIYEAQDFTVGLFDAEGNTISIGLGLPMFIRGLSDALKAKLAFYGLEKIEPGDILLTNDAYVMGSHLNHMIFTLPIFYDGEIVAFAASMAHWLDIGGVVNGATHDIFSEGLQVPIVKLFKRGVQDDELTRLIATNVRFPDQALGDLRAQVAAIRTGEARMQRMLERHGAEVVKESIRDMYARSEQMARRAVQGIADGVYTAEAFMDDDGVRIGERVPIRVRVVVAGDSMTVDLSGVSPQVSGYFNSGASAGRSAAEVAFKCVTSPSEFPINDGALRPLEVILPPGTVVSAEKPAAMRQWMTYPMTVVDCIFRALAPAVPGGTIAGHHADLAAEIVTGVDDLSGRFYMYVYGAPGGGWGATLDRDGECATICVNDGDTHNTPVEAFEAKYPMAMIEEYSLRKDSGGPGRSRGGLGTRSVVRVNSAARLNAWMDRTVCAPWGIDGGRDGLPNRLQVLPAESDPPELTNGKLDGYALAAMDRFVVETGGGGGWGDPRQRPHELVLRDVQAGYVSVEAAEHIYGVTIDRESAEGGDST